jgi:hypothetical protein
MTHPKDGPQLHNIFLIKSTGYESVYIFFI